MGLAQQPMAALVRRLVVLFMVASAINLPWEVLQMPLYDVQVDWLAYASHCFVPSLGDGVILLVIFLVGVMVFRSAEWADRPGLAGYALMLACGAVVSVGVEWGAVHVLRRWSYAPGMPQVPGLDVGLVPIVQMLVLPSIVFKVTAWCLRRLTRPV